MTLFVYMLLKPYVATPVTSVETWAKAVDAEYKANGHYVDLDGGKNYKVPPDLKLGGSTMPVMGFSNTRFYGTMFETDITTVKGSLYPPENPGYTTSRYRFYADQDSFYRDQLREDGSIWSHQSYARRN